VQSRALLPGSEITLEEARSSGRPRAVVMIARNGNSGRHASIAYLQHFGSPADFRLKAESGGIAGENHVIGPALAQLRHERCQDFVRPSKAMATTKPTEIDPGRVALVEPIA